MSECRIVANSSEELEITSSQGSFSKLPSGAGDGEEAEGGAQVVRWFCWRQEGPGCGATCWPAGGESVEVM